MGFVWGRVYEADSKEGLADVTIEAGTGEFVFGHDEIPFLPETHQPGLTSTQSSGEFFIINAEAGQMHVKALLPDNSVIERTIEVWPLASYEGKAITQLEIAISPDDAWRE